MIVEKRFVSHYMLNEAIVSEAHYRIWSAEEMRSNKACRIIECFDIDHNPEGDQRLRVASEIKNNSLPFVVKILEVFKEENSGFIVSEMPASGALKPEKIFDSQKFFDLGSALLKAFVLMQRNGIGIEKIGYADIFRDNGRSIQLMFSEGLILKPEKEDRSNEIRVFARFLLHYAFSDREVPEPLTNEFLKENFPEKIAAFFDETLLQGKIERLEMLNHYFESRNELKLDSKAEIPETRKAGSRFAFYSVMVVILVIGVLFLRQNSEDTVKISPISRTKSIHPKIENTERKVQNSNPVSIQEENSSVSVKSKPISEPIPVSENRPKYNAINYKQFHTYWIHAISGRDVDGVQRVRGMIYGCGEEGFNNPVEIVSLDHDVRSIVVDENRNIYWTDITTGEIMKADPDGHNVRAIVKGLMYPIALTIDNKNKKLYWNDWQQKIDPQKGYIGRSDLNGQGAEIVVRSGLRSGGTIKIDEREEKIYVADLFGKQIVRINLDGTNMVPIAYSAQPAGLDIDYDHRRIYWTDLNKDGIYACDYDGRNQQSLYSNGDGFSNPEALLYDRIRQKIFFAQSVNFQDNIFSIDLNGKNLRNEYAQAHLYIHAIVQP